MVGTDIYKGPVTGEPWDYTPDFEKWKLSCAEFGSDEEYPRSPYRYHELNPAHAPILALPRLSSHSRPPHIHRARSNC